jgi:hypothetical protein
MNPWYMAVSEASSICIAQLQLSALRGVGALLMFIGVWSKEGVGAVLSTLSIYQVCSLLWMRWIWMESGRCRPSK